MGYLALALSLNASAPILWKNCAISPQAMEALACMLLKICSVFPQARKF